MKNSLLKVSEKYALFKVLNKLIETQKTYSVRELASVLKISPNTVSYCLRDLLKCGVLDLKMIGRTAQYSVKKGNSLVKQYKIMKSIDNINSAGLVDELLDAYGTKIMSITLYSSCARGDYDNKSDLDLLVITNTKIRMREFAFEKKLSREYNIINYTWSDWRAKTEKDKVFYEKIVTEGIAIHGELPIVR